MWLHKMRENKRCKPPQRFLDITSYRRDRGYHQILLAKGRVQFGQQKCHLESNICSPNCFSLLGFFLIKNEELIYTSTQDNHNTASLMKSNRADLHSKLKHIAFPSANRISITLQVPGRISSWVLVLRLR